MRAGGERRLFSLCVSPQLKGVKGAGSYEQAFSRSPHPSAASPSPVCKGLGLEARLGAIYSARLRQGKTRGQGKQACSKRGPGRSSTRAHVLPPPLRGGNNKKKKRLSCLRSNYCKLTIVGLDGWRTEQGRIHCAGALSMPAQGNQRFLLTSRAKNRHNVR